MGLGSSFDSQNGFTILGTRFGSPDLSNFQHTLYSFHNDSAILGAGFDPLMALPFWVPNLAALLLNLFWVPNVAPLMALPFFVPDLDLRMVSPFWQLDLATFGTPNDSC